MSDEFVLKMYEVQAELSEREQELSKTKQELIETKQELERIRKENDELKNQMAVNHLVKMDSDGESSVKDDLAPLPGRVSNYDDIFSETSENFSKVKEILNKHDTSLSHHSEVPTKQNEVVQVLNTSENNSEKQAILLLGGRDNDWNNVSSLLILENNGQNWKQSDIKLPYAGEGYGAQFLNNHLYIFGGQYSEILYLNCTYKFSKSLQWDKMADMGQRCSRISNSSVILSNHIWVCGGKDEKKKSLRNVQIYNPRTNTWKYMEPMNNRRSDAAAAVVNGKIYCSGGSSNGNWLNATECYDPSSDVWTLISNMPEKIRGYGVVEIDGSFIIVGGWNSFGNCLKNVWALDTADKNAEWVEKPSMSIPHDRFSIAKIHNEIFVCGGHGAWDNMEIFDGEAWRNGPTMPASRCLAPAVVIPMKFARYFD